MTEVIKVSDSEVLAPTDSYPYAKWPFENFNPVQSRLIDLYEGDSNAAVAAATSAGKTVCSEMYLAYEIHKRGGKGIYVGPLRALAKEKEDDWKDDEHHFYDLNLSIVTGDFQLTKRRISELDEANLVIMTPEMLASRCRNHKSDKSQFLSQVGTVAFDESHLLTVPNRGDHIEVALMKMTEINPDIRILLLSATMPNVDEICGWVSSLTKRKTYYLESDYRPCPLNIHYETYYDGDNSYWDREQEKVNSACSIVEDHENDKFLIFVHTKSTGQLMLKTLKEYGIGSEFHNANLDLKKRLDLESRFKNDPNFRVLVATSTLAWGCNLPARRVIVTGVHRGLQEVENYDIQQMIGRAGRPKYDPMGDAYILVPENGKNEWVKKIKVKSPIKSTLLDTVGSLDNPHYKTLAFHIVSEIHQGHVKTSEGFHKWFRRSLAHYQDQGFNDEVVDRTITLLQQYRAILVEGDEYKCTAIGKVASMFYYSPFDVSNFRRNFKFLFDNSLQSEDYALSMALGNIDTFRWGVVSRKERDAMSQFETRVKKLYGENSFTNAAIKHGYSYFLLLKGRKNIPEFQSLQGALQGDLERTIQVLNALDTMSAKWGRHSWFRNLKLRLQYGVTSDLVELCQIPNVGQARAKKLKSKRIRNVEDFLSYDVKTLSSIMGCSPKLAEDATKGAKLIKLKESIDV